jgi:ribonucleoside-diphosphate reductase subunit M2
MNKKDLMNMNSRNKSMDSSKYSNPFYIPKEFKDAMERLAKKRLDSLPLAPLVSMVPIPSSILVVPAQSCSKNYSDKYNLHEEKDPEAWDYYKKQLAQRWDPDEILLSEDKDIFNVQSDRIKELVKDLVAFFAPGDGLVCEQVDHLKDETADFSQRAFLGEQYSIEVVHARAYKDSILTFFDEKTQIEIFESVDTLPCVREKADFISKYMMNKNLPLSLRYVAAAASEGIFFVSLFAIIFIFRERKILNKFVFLNEQVSKDEKLHRDFDVMMATRGFKAKEFTEAQALEILTEAYNIEKAHVDYILRKSIFSEEIDKLSEITLENMHRYIATLADQIVTGMGMTRHFSHATGVSSSGAALEEFSPPWMKAMSMGRKTNFYEQTVGSYSMISQKKAEDVDIKAAFSDLEGLDI